MKDLAKGKVSDLNLAKMTVPYQLLNEPERVSENPRTDIRELFESTQRVDLLKKPEVSLHDGVELRENTKRGALLHGVPYGVPKMEYP